MPQMRSGLDPDAIAQLRALLAEPERPERLWPTTLAAGFFAAAAVAFAAAMIMAPPLVNQHVVAASQG